MDLRAASRTTIQPDCDFVRGSWVLTREEPEEELILVAAVAVDGQSAGVGLANVEVHFGNAGAVDLELWTR